eukprot:gene11967-13204_t
MKRNDLDEVPYSDAEYSPHSHIQLSDISSAGKASFWPAFFATLVVALGPFNFGYALGYSSPVESKLEDSTQSFCVSKDEFSWFASLLGVGAIGGALIGGWAIEFFGRKTALMLYSVPFASGWLLISNSKHSWMLLLGRILVGIAVGSTSLTVPVYIAEIAHPKYRGGLGSINQLAVTLGVVIAYAVGGHLTWQMSSLFAVGPITLLLLLMLFMPETPRWLLANNQRFIALRELTWLRGKGYDSEEECFEIESNLDMQERMTIGEFGRPGLLKPLVIGILMMVFQQFSGVNAIVFYSANIFKNAGMKDANLVAIMFALAQFISTAIACLLVDRSGRRVLLLIGGFGMCICNVCLGIYYDLAAPASSNTTSVTTSGLHSSIYHSIPNEHISWLAVTSAIVFIVVFSLGWGPLPWLLMSEIFPPRARGLAGGICTLINWLFVFVVTKNFPSMIDAFTEQGTFWFFAAWCFASFIFVYFFVPETKGRTLEEIEHYFVEGSFPDYGQN